MPITKSTFATPKISCFYFRGHMIPEDPFLKR